MLKGKIPYLEANRKWRTKITYKIFNFEELLNRYLQDAHLEPTAQYIKYKASVKYIKAN